MRIKRLIEFKFNISLNFKVDSQITYDNKKKKEKRKRKKRKKITF